MLDTVHPAIRPRSILLLTHLDNITEGRERSVVVADPDRSAFNFP